MDYRDLLAGINEDNFWFKAKNNLIGVLMNNACNGSKKLNILNVGAGTGSDLKVLSRFGNNYLIDVNEEALSLIDKDYYTEKKVADICSLPYPDEFFDAAVSFDVFEHIQDDHNAVREIYRVLKKNGVLVFIVPAFQFLFSSHDKALQHYRRYNVFRLKNLITAFNNHKIYYWNSVLIMPIIAMRLLKKFSRPGVDRLNLPRPLNSLLYKILLVDNYLIKRKLSFPVGLSLAGYCYK